MKEQIYENLRKLLIQNNIRVNQDELNLQLLSHPSYPSMHSLTGVLDHFRINNLALRLPVNKETVKQLPPYFMANILEDGGEFLVLTEKKRDRIQLSYENEKVVLVSEEAFLKIWNGVILAIEKDEHVKETKTSLFTQTIQKLFYFLGFLFLGYFLYSCSSYFSQAHFLLSMVGLLLSGAIVQHELGLQSAAANKLCNRSENTSCDDVLNSKGATLFGSIKLSDLSIVAFTTYTLNWILLFLSGTANFSVLSLLTLFAIPFTIYSVYYQYQVVKKWCPLCLAIVAVLLLQASALLSLDSFTSILAIDTVSIALFLGSFIVASSAWHFIKPLLVKARTLENLEVEHYRFKRNYSLFDILHRHYDSIPAPASIPGEMVFGNENAAIEILMVTHPFCHYCKQAHEDIEQILKGAKGKVKVTLRFNVSGGGKEDTGFQIASRILHLYDTQGKTVALHALDQVFGKNADGNKWLQSQQGKRDTSYDHILEKQGSWCRTHGINFTPAVYLNNRLFPYEYDRTDLLYFLDDLTEVQTLNSDAA